MRKEKPYGEDDDEDMVWILCRFYVTQTEVDKIDNIINFKNTFSIFFFKTPAIKNACHSAPLMTDSRRLFISIGLFSASY